jgi:hypothetical protein
LLLAQFTLGPGRRWHFNARFGPHEHAVELRKSLSHPRFDAVDQRFDLRHAQAVDDVDAQGRNDLVRSHLRGDDVADIEHTGLLGNRLADRVAKFRRRLLADQQFLAFARKQHRDRREHDADQDRRDPVDARIA